GPVGTAVGAEVVGVERDQLTRDEVVAAVAEALEAHGALVFRGLDLDPETQVGFCRKLGDVDDSTDGHHPVAGIYRVTLDTSKNPRAEYLYATFHWHIDGCTPAGGECPQIATLLTATAVAERGGDTEFASTYAAYDALTQRSRSASRPCASSTRSKHPSDGSPRTRLSDSSPDGDRGPRRSTHWCGRTDRDDGRW